MTSISAASINTYQSPLQKLQNELLSEVNSGAISSSDKDALSAALTDIDSAMQASRTSDQASGTRPSPDQLKSKIDDLIAGEVSSGKLTSDQATELQGVFKAAFANGPGGAGGPGGPGGAGGPPPGGPGGPPPADDASSSDDSSSSSTTSIDDILKQFLQSLQESLSASSSTSYGATGTSSSSSSSFSALLIDYQSCFLPAQLRTLQPSFPTGKDGCPFLRLELRGVYHVGSRQMCGGSNGKRRHGQAASADRERPCRGDRGAPAERRHDRPYRAADDRQGHR